MARYGAAIAALGAGALVLSGCSAPAAESGLDEGTSVTVAWNQAFFSANGNTSYGNATANNNINYLTQAGFWYYDNTPELQWDESFGTVELESEDPLTVKYTLADTAKWSDGEPVDAADLLLSWAALSKSLDTPDFDATAFTDQETGEFTDEFPTDVVYFDSGATPDSGLGLVHDTPEVSDDGKSVTMVYSQPYVDWQLALNGPLPAHIIAKHALGIEDGDEAKAAVIDAIENDDAEALAKLSADWNSGFNYTSMPEDEDRLVSSGPYLITDFAADEYITLKANEAYEGKFAPHIEEVTVRFIPDPLAAAQALANGEVDVIQPQATADLVEQLEDIEDITINTGVGGTYEHVDLQIDQSKNGTFADPLVREAFLKVVPRQEILDKLIAPITGDGAELRGSFNFVPGAEGYDESLETSGIADYAEVDVEGAKALLAEAGVTSPEVCLLYASNNPRRVNEFALIQASAAQAGFNVTDCGSEEWGGLLGTPGAYDASLFGWQSTSLGVSSVGPNYETGGINNMSFYSNPEVDALVQELNTSFDHDRQIEIQVELDKLLLDDAFGITIFQHPEVTAFSNTLSGVSSSPLAPTVFWNIWDWEVVEAE
ncbi:ABC transporter family substrate-binding protein [Agromyces sp. MMS17-SY077]|uniref:ABC transporter family substrate-binding protein n=1 Tax=Agromyces seonyuensis TaxID=2662446 RepID=A0A6I4NV64_9MICO|nr:ABC transporter family substrate-binding protein [Agromyces seonyuensis]